MNNEKRMGRLVSPFSITYQQVINSLGVYFCLDLY